MRIFRVISSGFLETGQFWKQKEEQKCVRLDYKCLATILNFNFENNREGVHGTPSLFENYMRISGRRQKS